MKNWETEPANQTTVSRQELNLLTLNDVLAHFRACFPQENAIAS